MIKFLKKISLKFKRNKEKYPVSNIEIGNISLETKVKRKVVNKNLKQLRIVKFNGKTQFYTVKLSDHETLQLSVFGKKFIKDNPDIFKYISENIFTKKINLESFENNNYKCNFKKLTDLDGLNHRSIIKFDILSKKDSNNFSFFIKVTNSRFLANNEFIANQGFQKYGINTIKPHFAYTDFLSKKSLIVYDFSNLENLNSFRKKISKDDLEKINKKIYAIRDVKNLPSFYIYGKKSIGDYTNYNNIFVKKKENGKIELYFSDLLISTPVNYY